MKREAELKSEFSKELARQLPGFLTLCYGTAGAPDRSIVGGSRQTNWEFKHACPTFDSPANQELMCMRLAAAGHCRYVFWYETAQGNAQRTMIVHPLEVHRRTSWILTPETWCEGFDHRWLVEQIRKAHGL